MQKITVRGAFPSGNSRKEASSSDAGLQGLAHVTHKRVMSKRLLQKAQRSAVETMMFNGVVGIARHIENLDSWMASGDLAGEFPARHTGHNDVR